MKHLVSVLLITVLLGPSLGLVCNCCPLTEPHSSANLAITRAGCGCCPDAIQIEEKKLAVQKDFGSILFSAFSRWISVFTNSFQAVPHVSVSTSLKDTGPPGIVSNTPLYLAHPILLI